MKKNSLVVLFVLFSFYGFGQTQSAVYKKYVAKKKYSEGFVLLKDSSKVEGALKYPSRMLGNITLITKQGEKRAIMFNEMLAYRRSDSYYETDGSMFYKLVKRGKNVSYFERIVTTSTPTGNGMMMTNSSTVKYFRKTGSMYFEQVSSLNFARDMAKFFSDCPNLSERLSEKQFSYKAADSLVDAYDLCSASN